MRMTYLFPITIVALVVAIYAPLTEGLTFGQEKLTDDVRTEEVNKLIYLGGYSAKGLELAAVDMLKIGEEGLPYLKVGMSVEDPSLRRAAAKLHARVAEATAEKYVNQLGATTFVLRDQAAKKLRQLPGALPVLRRHLKDGDLERQRRTGLLVEEMHRNQFKKSLKQLANQKQAVPIDLLAELVSQNKQFLDDEDWNTFLTAVGSVKENLTGASRIKPKNLPDLARFRRLHSADEYPDRRGRAFSKCRGLGHNVPDGSLWNESAVVTVGGFKTSLFTTGILFSNGKVDLRSAWQSCVVCDEIDADHIQDCLVVARGRVNARRIDSSVIVEKAANSPFAHFFSSRTFGLMIAREGNGVQAIELVEDSPAAHSDYRHTDIVDVKFEDLRNLELTARQAFAKQEEFKLPVKRNGKQHHVAIWYWN